MTPTERRSGKKKIAFKISELLDVLSRERYD
jgi:hypothetical protein